MSTTVRIEVLNKDNYETWREQVKALLIKNDAWEYVNGTLRKPAEPAEALLWEVQDAKARADLILSISPTELRHVRGTKTAHECWTKLSEVFASSGPAKKATLLKQLVLYRMREEEDMREHLLKFFEAKDKLDDMGIEIHRDLTSIILLYSLPASYENFRVAIESRDELPDPEILKVKILEESNKRFHQRRESEGVNMMARGNKYKKEKVKTKSPGKFGYKCFKCHKQGHKASECPDRQNVASVGETNSFNMLLSVSESCNGVQRGLENGGWLIDSGCTSHLCKTKQMFKNLSLLSGKLNLATNANTTTVRGKGSVVLSGCNDRSSPTNVELQDTLYVPNLRYNLLSVSKITSKGYNVSFEEETCHISDSDGNIMLIGDRRNNLYYLRESHASASAISDRNCDLLEWHERLGHLNNKDLLKVVKKIGEKVDTSQISQLYDCKVCARAKMSSLPFSKSSGPCDEKLKIVYSDVVGPIHTEAIGGAKYFVTFIDDSTRWCEVFLLKRKNEVFEKFIEYKSFVENLFGKRIKFLQTDNGGEFCNKVFDDFLKQEGIVRRLTIPHTPQQNGIAERMNRTLVEMGRCMLLSSNLPARFWGDAVLTACHVRNRCPTSSLNGDIPYEKWFDKPVSVDYLRKFGTEVYVLDKSRVKDKFEAKSVQGVFIGYPRNQKGYKVWIPSDRKSIVARDVKFCASKETVEHNLEADPFLMEENENCEPKYVEIEKNIERYEPRYVEIDVHDLSSNSMPARGNGGISEYLMPETSEEVGDRISEGREPEGDRQAIMKRAPGRPQIQRGQVGRPRKIYRMVEVSESEAQESLQHEEEHRSREDDVQIGRQGSSRNRQGSSVDEACDEFHDAENSEEAEFIGAAEISLRDALKDVDHELWKEAILLEIRSLLKNETWQIVKKPVNREVVGCRYVLTTKLNVDKTTKKKARLVAKGYSQRYGVDYFNTFSPVVRLDSIRLLSALAVELDMEVHQLDINSAYLNGYLDEEVYMEIPPLLTECLHKLVKDPEIKEQASRMLSDLKTGGDTCFLKRSLYGLKQAGRQWNKRLDEKFKYMGLIQSLKEPCFYYKNIDNRGTKLFVTVFVDDILVASQKRECIETFKRDLNKEFELKDYGLASYFLGIDFVKKDDIICLSQQKYIKNLLVKFGLDTAKETISTPMEVGLKLNEPSDVLGEKYPFRELIGSLIYLSSGTRPDITHAVVKLAAFTDCAKIIHWIAAKRILRYLKKTIDHGLVFRKTGKSLIGYSDADWGNCPIDRKSYSGFSFILGGAAISWKSQKQKCVTTSTCEAEYVSLSLCVKEAVYLQSFLFEIGLKDFASATIHADNQGAICLSNDPVFHSRTKHIDIQYHYIRSIIKENENIKLKYVPTEEMLADILTKALNRKKHFFCASGLGVCAYIV